MTRLTIRDKDVAAIGALLLIVVSVATYVLGVLTAPKYTFYDGEGNVIPYRALDSLVLSQFMDRSFSKAGRDTVERYFPISTLRIYKAIDGYTDNRYFCTEVFDSTLIYYRFNTWPKGDGRISYQFVPVNASLSLDSAILIKKQLSKRN